MSSAERTHRNAFAATPLDRCGEYRADAAWLAAQRAAPTARFLGCDAAGHAPARDGRLCWQPPTTALRDAPANFLGQLQGVPVWALRAPVEHATVSDAQWLGLRAAATVLDATDAGIFAYARGLANWQQGARYCNYCGGALHLVAGGQRAECSACGRLHFPRTDAAIIVIVEQGDACLLGRQAAWRAHQYSTLAGFVETAETLADAVRREVREETGVRILDCDFHSSQPWPFPASLMLGFTAVAAGRAIRLADGELEDARWFTAHELRAGLADGSLRLPTPASIAWRLIEHWLRTRAGVELGELPGADAGA
ncbi:MAG TPA: NAD(+) diphosphatase [Rhodanobacteraceae bacterium]|nr:NAD(+) diphosphatase [Rhodanobacteraceae bacterium]